MTDTTTDSTDVQERLNRLESLVEQQQETIQQQRERITELEGETDSDETPLLANRRTALKAGGLAALLFGGVGTASADPQGQVGTSSHPLKKLYTEELNGGITGDTALTDMTGTGLQIASGSLGIDSNGVGSTELASDSVTVAGNSVSLGGSTGITYVDLGDTGSSFPIPNGDIANSSLTVAGNSVSLGGSTAVNYVDLSDTGRSFPIPNGDLDNSSLEVAGNSVSLGGSTGITYVDLSDTGSSFPIPNGDLVNDSVTVSSGNGLTGGGEVSLGESTTLAIDTGGVGSDELGTNAVGTDELDSDSVESDQIASGAVGTDEINTGFATLATLFSDTPVKVGGNGSLKTNEILASDDNSDGVLAIRADKNIKFTDESGGATTFSFEGGTTIGTTLLPDSSLNIGSSTARWDTVYANSTNTSSDARLKQAITGFEGGLDRLSDVRPISYEWADRDDPDTRLGFVAQELEEAVPEAVSRPEEEDGYLGVEYDMLLPVAIDAIQTQQEHIDDLEAENADLRERNADLETRLERVEAELGLDATADRQGVADD